MKQEVEDPIVVAVMTKFYERSQVGIKKYNTMLTRDDYDLIDWLTEAQQEAMDLALYCEAAINCIKNKK
jgi:succinate dehydrogenase flavin-adding protein (antitoxin of CptAB toxin-antitoxin module)